METPIHYLKSRNSDYLAGADLEIFELEGKSKILTVESVQYKENFKVNGRKKDKGIVMTFKEAYAKPLIVNPTNSRIIKDLTGVIDASKWKGFSVEFYYNTKVEMKVSRTETIKGGIRIKSVDTNGLIAPLEDTGARLKQVTNTAELMALWQGLDERDQATYKDEFTTKRKAL